MDSGGGRSNKISPLTASRAINWSGVDTRSVLPASVAAGKELRTVGEALLRILRVSDSQSDIGG